MPTGRRQARLWWVAQAAVLFAWWLMLVGTIDPREAAAGAVAAAIGAAAMHLVERRRLAKLVGHAGWFLQIWRLPKYVVTDTWDVAVVLARQLFARRPAPSLVYSVPFDACGDDEASSTKRALAVSYTTMTPSFVVIGVDQDRRRMVYHQVKKSEVPRMTRRLGAHP